MHSKLKKEYQQLKMLKTLQILVEMFDTYEPKEELKINLYPI